MSQSTAVYNRYQGELIIEELRRCGVDLFVVSPGSRSTPLTMAVARNGSPTIVHYDERGAGYFTVGYARATGRPAALICTSGTAAVNYHPAVVEAALENLPVILLTADRPPELKGVGGNQSIDQKGLYGEYVVMELDLACPDDNPPALALLESVDRAYERAISFDGGPVHINCRFRKPLYPAPDEQYEPPVSETLAQRPDSDATATVVAARQPDCPPDLMMDLVNRIKEADNGLIVAGRLETNGERQAVVALAEHLNWPICPDILSGLRLGSQSVHELIVPYFDLYLATERFPRPENLTVLHLGGRYVSLGTTQFLKQITNLRFFHVSAHDAVIDPDRLGTARYQSDLERLGTFLKDNLAGRQRTSWARQIIEGNQVISGVVDGIYESSPALSEPGVMQIMTRSVPAGHALFVGNSMPVRDMNAFGAPGHGFNRVAGNRGVSGIDGNLATAAGFAAGLERPVCAIIGDLTLLHDLNSLVLFKDLRQPSIVVVLNNQGGGIFDLLPIAAHREALDRFFVAEHSLDFAGAAQQYRLAYHLASTPGELKRAVAESLGGDRPVLIEVTLDRRVGHELREDMIREVTQRLGERA